MMTEKRKTSTAECTHAAVCLVTEQGDGVGETARHLGRNVTMRRRWKRALPERAHGAFPGTGPLSPAQEDLHGRRDAVQRRRMAREMLQNAARCFANAAP